MGVKVTVENVVKGFKTGYGVSWAIRKANFSINNGEFSIIIGPSGSGKSTIISIIAGLDKPTKGKVVVGEFDVTRASWRELALMRRKLIGYAPQADIAVMKASVEFNIALPLLLRGYNRSEAYRRVKEIARDLWLEHTLGRPASTMSGGELRRLAVARALITRPELILLDEPTSSLDEETAFNVWSLISEYHKNYNPTIIIATHDKNGLKFSDKVIHAKHGIIE